MGSGKSSNSVFASQAGVTLLPLGFLLFKNDQAAVLGQNGGTEASMEWVLAHMGDPDFNDPLSAPAAPGASASEAAPSSAKTADPDSLAMLTGMGFTHQQVRLSGWWQKLAGV